MKRITLIFFFFFLLVPLFCQSVKKSYLWLDCQSNYNRLSYPDSIDYYLTRIKDIGFTDVVVDVKSIMGEVLYDSEIAPYMGEWKGVKRERDYDMLSKIIKKGGELGVGVYASLNLFSGGHNFYDRGIIYGEHKDWQSTVYWQGKMIPISEMKWNYNGMLNPANPEVREYEMNILKEFTRKYPLLKGIILDRVRYDDITSDFSLLSKELFEEYNGKKIENFPEDILYWENNAGQYQWREGPLFPKWIEWRAMVIKTFFERVRRELKEINPQLEIGNYTGAWYPTYYYLGANWASASYDPSKDYKWASEEYYKSGYGDLLDIYMSGLYYSRIKKLDNNKENRNSEPAMSPGNTDWYSVEGGAELAQMVLRGCKAPFIASLYVKEYQTEEEFAEAVSVALEKSDGVMIFDLNHIIYHNWWKTLRKILENAQF